MNKLIFILKKKPTFFIILCSVYLALVTFIKWRLAPDMSTVWFILGGVIGIYFMDIAEDVFAVNPSPFRTILFAAAFACVSFFVVTSSGNAFPIGLVLTLFLTMMLWMYGEWSMAGSIRRWYQMINATISPSMERWGMIALAILFFLETLIFIRS